MTVYMSRNMEAGPSELQQATRQSQLAAKGRTATRGQTLRYVGYRAVRMEESGFRFSEGGFPGNKGIPCGSQPLQIGDGLQRGIGRARLRLKT